MNGFAKVLRGNQTDAERTLWRHLRNRQIGGYKFRRQVPIGNYIVDFVCFETRLIIEVDGGQHAVQLTADEARTDWLQSQGFTVLRFWNNDVLKNTAGVVEQIREHLTAPHPVPLPQGERV